MVHWPKYTGTLTGGGVSENFFLSALFFSKSAPRSLAPPQLFEASYAPVVEPYYGIVCLKIYECFVRYHYLRIP